MDILESITKTLGLDSLGKSLGLDWFKNAIPSFKKAIEVANQNKDSGFFEKIGIFWTAFNEEKDKLDGEKKEIAKTTDEKVKATLEGVKAPETTPSETPAETFRINMPQGGSVVDAMKTKMKEQKKEMARLIESIFTKRLKEFDKDLPDEAIRKIVIVAISSAYGESTLNPNVPPGDHGKGIGLFQVHPWGGSVEYRQNPENNINLILDKEVFTKRGKTLIARAKAGADIPELMGIFTRKIMRSAKQDRDIERRIGYAKAWFGEDLSSTPRAVASAPTGKEVVDGNLHFDINLGGSKQGFCDIASGQKNWFFGSSSVVGTPKSMGGRLGIKGIGSTEFMRHLENEWWGKITAANLKFPENVVIAGMGQNEVSSDSSVKRTIASYEKIRTFLSARGVKNIKFVTVQPADSNGQYVAKFNTALKKQYGRNCIDATTATTEAGGTRIADAYVGRKKNGEREGIHLNKAGKKLWNDIVLGALNEGQKTA